MQLTPQELWALIALGAQNALKHHRPESRTTSRTAIEPNQVSEKQEAPDGLKQLIEGHNTPSTVRLHPAEKVHVFACLNALKNGYYPSNKDAIECLDTIEQFIHKVLPSIEWDHEINPSNPD